MIETKNLQDAEVTTWHSRTDSRFARTSLVWPSEEDITRHISFSLAERRSWRYMVPSKSVEAATVADAFAVIPGRGSIYSVEYEVDRIRNLSEHSPYSARLPTVFEQAYGVAKRIDGNTIRRTGHKHRSFGYDKWGSLFP